MLQRRIFLAFWAPSSATGLQGELLGAVYSSKLRMTRIYFERNQSVFEAIFEHDSGVVGRPMPSVLPSLPVTSPKIRILQEQGQLIAHDGRRKIGTLMSIDRGMSWKAVYPVTAHPDMTVIWSIESRFYYTNNDYKNVYLLPPAMQSGREKPKLLSQ
jgi:hypothetical protein